MIDVDNEVARLKTRNLANKGLRLPRRAPRTARQRVPKDILFGQNREGLGNESAFERKNGEGNCIGRQSKRLGETLHSCHRPGLMGGQQTRGAIHRADRVVRDHDPPTLPLDVSDMRQQRAKQIDLRLGPLGRKSSPGNASSVNHLALARRGSELTE